YFVVFNCTSALGGRPELRRALAGIVRTHDLVRATLGRFAQPAEGLLPPGILGHDPGRRRTLLTREAAGEALRATALPLPIRLTASVQPVLRDRYGSVTQELFRLFAQLGVEVTAGSATVKTWLESLESNRGFDLLI